MFHTAPESIWCSEVAVCCDALAGWLLLWRKQAAALPWNMGDLPDRAPDHCEHSVTGMMAALGLAGRVKLEPGSVGMKLHKR